ncbi:MAG: hypothetical protein IJ201_06765 [Solobacterium sp.]|nr:hypothetical protein [Solobacterium sp.]
MSVFELCTFAKQESQNASLKKYKFILIDYINKHNKNCMPSQAKIVTRSEELERYTFQNCFLEIGYEKKDFCIIYFLDDGYGNEFLPCLCGRN